MTAIRRLWTRDVGPEALTACTALDVGTEFAKALVFDIRDGKGGGRPEMAQGRGTNRSGIAAAMTAMRDRVASSRS